MPSHVITPLSAVQIHSVSCESVVSAMTRLVRIVVGDRDVLESAADQAADLLRGRDPQRSVPIAVQRHRLRDVERRARGSGEAIQRVARRHPDAAVVPDRRRPNAVVGQSLERGHAGKGGFGQANEAAAHADPEIALTILEERSGRSGEPMFGTRSVRRALTTPVGSRTRSSPPPNAATQIWLRLSRSNRHAPAGSRISRSCCGAACVESLRRISRESVTQIAPVASSVRLCTLVELASTSSNDSLLRR